jgi:hypothetical protein
VNRGETIQLIDLLAIIAFVVGLKRLSHPATARSGNTIAAAGMLAAIAATLADEGVVSYWAIAGAIAVGGAIGVLSARAVKMTAMPQMVALFNGVGGGGDRVAAAGGRGMREALEADDERDDREQVDQLDGLAAAQLSSLRLNICSMRSVTTKPPTTLIAPKATAIRPRMVAIPPPPTPATRIAPTITMPWIAFVPDISGVCSIVGTFEMTSKPTNTARASTVSSWIS